jgi:hypothetical protein
MRWYRTALGNRLGAVVNVCLPQDASDINPAVEFAIVRIAISR